jgi:hypothetical protein
MSGSKRLGITVLPSSRVSPVISSHDRLAAKKLPGSHGGGAAS